MTMRHVTIFGASSRQGQEQVGAALTEEHAVRAITRNAEIFADRTDARLEIVAADFEDPASLAAACRDADVRSEEHTSELQSLIPNSYAVFCLQKNHITHQ